MAKAYTKEFLISAYLYRFASMDAYTKATLEVLANKNYEILGKDTFRTSASLDADTLKKYRLALASK